MASEEIEQLKALILEALQSAPVMSKDELIEDVVRRSQLALPPEAPAPITLRAFESALKELRSSRAISVVRDLDRKRTRFVWFLTTPPDLLLAKIPEGGVREAFLSIWSYEPFSAVRYLKTVYLPGASSDTPRKGYISKRHCSNKDFL